MIKSHAHGHEIYYDGTLWRYVDNNAPLYPRPCKRCGKLPTKEGYDACLGYIKGAVSACCGHGVEELYILMEDFNNE